MNFQQIFVSIDNFIWGPPLLILLVGTGVYLSFRLKFLQIFRLPLALKFAFKKDKDDNNCEGDVSSFAALCTALSATIGTGNIVGVATAIKLGGPGALFWMWMAAFFGMATKYAEGLLAVKYREVDENGQMSGGPMYYIKNGLGHKPYSMFLAKSFSFFGIGVALFGIGTFPQVNAIVESTNIVFNIPIIMTAAIITTLVALVTLGGIKSISRVAEFCVPFMAIVYIIGCLAVLIVNYTAVPAAFSFIITSAFTPTAATGGFLGSTMILAMRMGVARGVFSNESGLGSAPIASAAAKTKDPAKQGLIAMTGTFIDTIVVCTMTGLVLTLTGAWSSDLSGAAMTNYAFTEGLNIIGQYIVTIGLMFFAFTTILGWNYYGERCTEFLFGIKGILPYKLIFIVLVASGAFLELELIWTIADIVNGLMAIPNLIALISLSGVVVFETKKYFNELEQSNMLKSSKVVEVN
ncbi:alanine/glycine:cation symporter family protein [Desulfonispora thiosulfatigenes]|nr:sodium:alanine symporter family protein [Desulfonispora thiosulfatigenes]